MGTLQDKVIVITGSSRGLGLAIARAAAAEGARVVISSRTADAVEAAAGGLRAAGYEATGIACDVSNLAQVEALAEHAIATFGRFNVWINNAGYAPPFGPTMHVAPSAFMAAVQTNIIGTYHGSLVALRAFLPEGRGKLINILGRGSDGKPADMQNGYAATKAWERSFTLGLAKEYKESGVGIYAINPGMMSTDFLTDLQAVSGYEKRLNAMPTIIRMWATPPEAPAQRVVWLASGTTDGKTGLSLSAMGPGKMLGGALREGWRRLTRRPALPLEMKIAVIPAACCRCRGPVGSVNWEIGQLGDRRDSQSTRLLIHRFTQLPPPMTYFGFLIRFIGVPLAIMALLTLWDRRRGRRLPADLRGLPAGPILLAHVVAAVVWTTPWDNYLVATGVWYYDPRLVTGITLGWVPIEEYTFFVVQTLLTGLWLIWLGKRLRPIGLPIPQRPAFRRTAAIAAGILWVAAVAPRLAGWIPGTYLALEVGWLGLPIILQLVVGADVLWHRRRLVAAALLPAFLYLSAADTLAIGSGTWSIAPAQSTGILLGGVLPIEEVLFFLLTNMLIVFGMVLMMGTDSGAVKSLVARLRRSRAESV